MAKATRLGGILSIYFVLSSVLAAQSGTLVVDQARVLYNSGSFQKAYDLIDKNITARSQDENLKKSAAMQLVVMGVSEWDLLNYRNAYSSFKKAVDLQPENPHPVAIQYKRDIETTMDIANLKNKDDAGIPGPTAKAPDVQALISKVWAEEQALSQAEKAQSAQKENAALKAQLEQQRSLNDETIQLLKRVAEKQPNPTVPVQPDPALQALSSALDDQTKILKSGSRTGILTVVVLILLGAIVLAALTLFLILVLKLRRQRSQSPSAAIRETLAGPSRPLLEFSGDNPPGDEETEMRRLSQRAARLALLIEEAKAGGRGWDSVRSCLDELDGDLKAEILALAEDKLEQGELLSNQDILPVVFPFLTDYDDSLRERAEKLAETALLGGGDPAESGPFGLKALLAIPEKLKAVLGGRDQSLATARLSRSIARQLGYSAADCQSLYKAAIAHDAGYLTLDAETLGGILGKTDLSDEEFGIIKTHTLKGPEYFRGLEIPEDIRDAMLYHHERNDGSGYPNGIKKDQIPLFARVIGVAESFTALIASRPHREKLDTGSALAIIRDARAKFDHDIVEALAAVVKSGGARK